MDPGRDLAQVADLIEEAFAGEMGEDGFAAVRELRAMAGMSPFVWLLSRTSSEFRDAFSGFVWEENGRVVGNVTLTSPIAGAQRWHISNVAVSQAYRGRGIGRRLVEAAVNAARERGGEWALLQVRHDNEPALHIYRSLGFESLFESVELTHVGPAREGPKQTPAGTSTLRRLGEKDWPAMLSLYHAAVEPMMRWTKGGLTLGDKPAQGWRLQDLLAPLWGGQVVRWFGQFDERVLIGMAKVRSHAPGGRWEISLFFHPAYYGRGEESLLRYALTIYRPGERTRLFAEHPFVHDQGVQAYRALGFEARRRLITMRLHL